jgi:hypothetical protein
MLFPHSRSFKRVVERVRDFSQKNGYKFDVRHFQRHDDEQICVVYEYTDGDELTFFFVKYKDLYDLYTKSINTFSLDEYDTSSIEPRLLKAKEKLDEIL